MDDMKEIIIFAAGFVIGNLGALAYVRDTFICYKKNQYERNKI